MYAYIKGTLTYHSPTYVILEAGGIGYEVNISLHTYDELPASKECCLYTYLAVREDAQVLYGFSSTAEKQLFSHLISVSGIGPNSARMILSYTEPPQLKQAIIEGNLSLLKSIKGVGPKSGQRIIVELQDALKKESGDSAAPASEAVQSSNDYQQAREGLIMLGFKQEEAEKALTKVMQKNETEHSTESLIKNALKIL
jgi:Holliday junction DNA helicase RuvA